MTAIEGWTSLSLVSQLQFTSQLWRKCMQQTALSQNASVLMKGGVIISIVI